MGLSRQLVRTIGAHLTVAAVLLAGLPCGLCRCPDGRVMLLGLIGRGDGCCCEGGCSSNPGATNAPSRPAHKACCGHCGHGDAGPVGSQARIGGPGCQKTLRQSGLTSVAPPQTSSLSGGAVKALAAAPAPDLCLAPRDVRCPRPGWANRPLPPPTDLVLSHLHLII